MGLNLKDYLVVGISSRALFDLDEENRIYEEQGLAAYSEYQIAHEDEVLAPGSGFALVKALLNLNTISDKRYVEVIIMSRNSADTSLRIFHSIEHYGLDISRAVLSGGSSLSNYLEAFDVDLFLSADSHDVEQAINSGLRQDVFIPIRFLTTIQSIKSTRFVLLSMEMRFCLVMIPKRSISKRDFPLSYKMKRKMLATI